MKCWLLLGSLTIATHANAQRPQIFPDCESGTLIPFNDGGNWGYLTVSGIAIPPNFKSALPFSGGLAIACTVKGCVVINTKGQFVSPVLDPNTSLLADRYTDGIGVVTKDGKWGYADLAGNVVIPLRFDFAGDFEKGVARVSQEASIFSLTAMEKESLLSLMARSILVKTWPQSWSITKLVTFGETGRLLCPRPIKEPVALIFPRDWLRSASRVRSASWTPLARLL